MCIVPPWNGTHADPTDAKYQEQTRREEVAATSRLLDWLQEFAGEGDGEQLMQELEKYRAQAGMTEE